MAYIPVSIRTRPSDGGDEERQIVPINVVFDLVNNYFQTTTEMLTSKSRRREIVWPRFVAMYLLAHFSSQTLKGIAVIFNKRDHTVTYHALQAVEDIMFTDAEAKKQIDKLTQQLKLYVQTRRVNQAGGDREYPGHA